MEVRIVSNKENVMPGSLLDGFVRLTLTKPAELRRLTCTLLCHHRAAFKMTVQTKDANGNVQESTRTCSEDKTLCRIEKDIGKLVVLEPGEHEFGFRFVVPEELPASTLVSTAEGEALTVAYTLRADVVREGCRPLAVEDTVVVLQDWWDPSFRVATLPFENIALDGVAKVRALNIDLAARIDAPALGTASSNAILAVKLNGEPS